MKTQMICKRFVFMIFLLLSISVSGYASFETQSEAASKAKAKFDLAESDTIYSSETDKALYYQNTQIIGLLEEIRDELKLQRKQKDEQEENGGVVL